MLLGVGVLAFIMTLNMREEPMPPIPTTEPYMHDLKAIGDEVRDMLDGSDDARAPGADDPGGVDSEAGDAIDEGVAPNVRDVPTAPGFDDDADGADTVGSSDAPV